MDLYPQFQTLEQRIDSYRKWYMFLVKSANELAEAGFFYTGERDLVCCFSCGFRKKDWLRRDVPMSIHIVRSPKCRFIASKLPRVKAPLNFCTICCDNIVTTMLAPCGHSISCIDCNLRLKYCPICRMKIEFTVDLNFKP